MSTIHVHRVKDPKTWKPSLHETITHEEFCKLGINLNIYSPQSVQTIRRVDPRDNKEKVIYHHDGRIVWREQETAEIHDKTRNVKFRAATNHLTYEAYLFYLVMTGQTTIPENPHGGGLLPVVNVNAYDIIKFVNWLNVWEGYDPNDPVYIEKSDGIYYNPDAKGWRIPSVDDWNAMIDNDPAHGGKSLETIINEPGSLDRFSWFNEPNSIAWPVCKWPDGTPVKEAYNGIYNLASPLWTMLLEV